jgi:hypothetical protein
LIKRLLIVLLILLGLAALADRFVASAAGDGAAAEVRRSTRADSADVTFHGFPFAAQAIRGRFDRVDVVARDVPESGLTLTRIDATFTGVRLELDKALAGEISGVPTDAATATVRVSYADLNAWLRERGPLSVAWGASGAVVSGKINVRGATVSGVGVASAAVNAKGVVLRVTEATAEGVQIPKSALGLLSVQLNLSDLPFGIKLTSAKADRDGLLVRGTATGIVIPTRR